MMDIEHIVPIWLCLLWFAFIAGATAIFRVVLRIERKTDRNLAHLKAFLEDSTRCPECGHPSIAAPFCENETYICPQCAEAFVWIIVNGQYILEKEIGNGK